MYGLESECQERVFSSYNRVSRLDDYHIRVLSVIKKG